MEPAASPPVPRMAPGVPPSPPRAVSQSLFVRVGGGDGGDAGLFAVGIPRGRKIFRSSPCAGGVFCTVCPRVTPGALGVMCRGGWDACSFLCIYINPSAHNCALLCILVHHGVFHFCAIQFYFPWKILSKRTHLHKLPLQKMSHKTMKCCRHRKVRTAVENLLVPNDKGHQKLWCQEHCKVVCPRACAAQSVQQPTISRNGMHTLKPYRLSTSPTAVPMASCILSCLRRAH